MFPAPNCCGGNLSSNSKVGINFSEEEGLRAHMRFSLATTSVGEGKKSDKHSKNRDPLKEN